MAVFAYKAKTEEGKVTRGKIEAISKKEALAELGMMDLIVFEVEPLNSFLNTEINLRSGLKPKDFIIFLRQFATLISAGILLVESLDLLAEQTTNPRLKAILEDLSTEVQEGSPLSVSMSKHPAVFPNLLIQMIQSAEVSGRLEEVLEQMANYYEKQYRNKQKSHDSDDVSDRRGGPSLSHYRLFTDFYRANLWRNVCLLWLGIARNYANGAWTQSMASKILGTDSSIFVSDYLFIALFKSA